MWWLPGQAVTWWVQTFASDAAGNGSGDSDGVGLGRDGFFPEEDGEMGEMQMQMECTVHEVLLKNQARRCVGPCDSLGSSRRSLAIVDWIGFTTSRQGLSR